MTMRHYKSRTFQTVSGPIEMDARRTRLVAGEMMGLRKELARVVKYADLGDCVFSHSMLRALEGSPLVNGSIQGPAFERARRAFLRAKAKVDRSCRRMR